MNFFKLLEFWATCHYFTSYEFFLQPIPSKPPKNTQKCVPPSKKIVMWESGILVMPFLPNNSTGVTANQKTLVELFSELFKRILILHEGGGLGAVLCRSCPSNIRRKIFSAAKIACRPTQIINKTT